MRRAFKVTTGTEILGRTCGEAQPANARITIAVSKVRILNLYLMRVARGNRKLAAFLGSYFSDSAVT